MKMTKEEMEARIKMLSDEMDANEEENRDMQQEINKLYAEIDKRDKPKPEVKK